MIFLVMWENKNKNLIKVINYYIIFENSLVCGYVRGGLGFFIDSNDMILFFFEWLFGWRGGECCLFLCYL